MRFSFHAASAGALFFLAFYAHATHHSTCTNGVLGFDNAEATVCCDVYCDQCGGPGCGDPTNTSVSADDCCSSNILENDQLCSVTKSAPCVLDPVVETCSNGLVGFDNDEATVCCDIHCEQCGGPGCGSPTVSFVSANDCCASNILDNNELCSVTESAPCVMDTAEDPVATCSNDLLGFENDAASVCCHISCDQCGGPGCGSPTDPSLSADDCCEGNILANDELCSVTESAPCVLDTYVATCSNDLVGVENDEATVCCDASCDQCGGPGCGSPTDSNLSANDCCVSNILANEEFCSVAESAPCVLDA
eukprot:jgi/Undpi1/12878/HiC_scaffold_7.g02545.m1